MRRGDYLVVFVQAFVLLLLGVSVVVSEGFLSSASPTTGWKGDYCRSTHGLTKQSRQLISSPMLAAVVTSTRTPSQSSTVSTSSLQSYNKLSRTVPLRGGGSKSKKGKLFAMSSDNSSSRNIEKGGGSTSCPFTKTMTIFGSLWGSMGVVYVLVKAIKRVLPIAMEPFRTSLTSLSLTPFQWSMYALSCLFFAYAEGYKGFHLKFAPLVVKRSFTLVIGQTPQGNNPINYILSPLYSMGLFSATRKRIIVSWSVTMGVAAIVAIVKKLPIVPRCILDAGVVVGLSLGSMSIVYHYVKAIVTGKLPQVDACLPAGNHGIKES